MFSHSYRFGCCAVVCVFFLLWHDISHGQSQSHAFAPAIAQALAWTHIYRVHVDVHAACDRALRPRARSQNRFHIIIMTFIAIPSDFMTYTYCIVCMRIHAIHTQCVVCCVRFWRPSPTSISSLSVDRVRHQTDEKYHVRRVPECAHKICELECPDQHTHTREKKHQPALVRVSSLYSRIVRARSRRTMAEAEGTAAVHIVARGIITAVLCTNPECKYLRITTNSRA